MMRTHSWRSPTRDQRGSASDPRAWAPADGFASLAWPITTRHLAAHTAGIRHYGDVEGVRLKGAPHVGSIREGSTLFQDDPLLFEPGTNYNYSSNGWTAVSAVIEGASTQRSSNSGVESA